MGISEECNHEWVDTTDFDSEHDEQTCIYCGAVSIVSSTDELLPQIPDPQTAVEDELLQMVRDRDKEIVSLRRSKKRLEGQIRGYKKSIARLKEAAGTGDRSRYRNKNHQGRMK